jgi:hypothetical protein
LIANEPVIGSGLEGRLFHSHIKHPKLMLQVSVECHKKCYNFVE